MLRKIAKGLRGIIWTLLLRARGAKIGKRLRIERGLQFRQLGRLSIGDDVHFGPNCIIDAPGALTIGSRAIFTAWNYVSALESVSIGDDALIGERVSIRDADHGMALGMTINAQDMAPLPITIGNDVWLGCGVVILRGTIIGNGAVAGANAVVRGNVEAASVVGGAPAKKISERHATPCTS